jgi:hypothetical protein
MNCMDHWNFASCEGSSPGRANPASHQHTNERAGILQRIFDVFARAQQRQAERAIAREFNRLGGRLTDDTERRITEWITRRRMF